MLLIQSNLNVCINALESKIEKAPRVKGCRQN